jgi:probable rRNA maturation factor
MVIDVFAADEQSERPVDIDRWSKLARDVLGAQGVKEDVEVSLLFVDEPTIAELHERFLGEPGPTDVLAFPIDEEPAVGGRSPDEGGTGPGGGLPADEDDMPVLLGDVVVCPTVAAGNAAAHGVSFEDEVALLVVHGLLHLLGMDHGLDDEAEKMERRERELLARFYRPAP